MNSSFSRLSVVAACLLSVTATNAADRPYGCEAAQAALAKDAKVAEGLEVTLFAAEPQIQNPTNIAIDQRGRVWAVEAVNYRSTFKPWGVLRPDGDRVVILEDTNDDGTADSEKIFWQSKDLQAPLGICVLPQPRGTQVIVSAAPNVWLLTDEDGDDHAERSDKLFQVGGGKWDHDHQIHAFVFGSDGKFYFNFGNEVVELLDAEGKQVVDLQGNKVTGRGQPYRQGMVLRCDIVNGKATNVETLAHNFRNNYEVCTDSFGTMWQSDNDDDGNKAVRINYVMEFGNYGYGDEYTGAAWQAPRNNIEPETPRRHWHLNDPGVVPNLLITGSGSPTGILLNEGTQLGGKFTNQIIHCDAGPRVVRAYPVQKQGAGYTAETVDILRSKDDWFRPSDVAIHPDGSLYIADWYDSGVGGHNMGDKAAGKIRGRIYRIAPAGQKLTFAAPDLSTATGAIAALNSPNLAIRYAAWQALHKLGAAAEPELLKAAQSADPRARARVYALLARIPGRAVPHLTSALRDADADVRVAAVRLCLSLATSGGLDTTPLESTPGLIPKLLVDPDPQVRRQIAISLHRAKDIAPLWAALAKLHDGQDRWYLEALGIGAAGNEDACFAAWLKAIDGQWDTPAGRDIIWRSRSVLAASPLAQIVMKTPAAEAPRYLRSFDFLPAGPEKTNALLKLATLSDATKGDIATEALRKLNKLDLEKHPEVKTVVLAALERSRGNSRFVDLVREFKLPGQGEGLLQIAVATPGAPAGVDAAKMLLGPEYRTMLEPSLQGEHAAKLLEALGNTADKRAVALLETSLTSASAAPALREQAAKALTKSQAGVEALLKMARENRFPQDLRPVATTALAAVQMPKFQGEITKLFPVAPPSTGAPTVAELAALRGDVARGKVIFAKTEATCVTCHKIGDVGVDFGPGLSEIGGKLGREALYESIVAPNAGVSMGFETTQLTMKNGDAALGILRSETADELLLAMPGGVQNRYKKSEVAKVEKLPYSLMPAGLHAILPRQDLVDLVEYLAALKKAP